MTIAVAPSPSEARPAGAEPPVPSTALPETALCAGFGALIAVAALPRPAAATSRRGKTFGLAGLPLGRLPTVESVGFERGTLRRIAGATSGTLASEGCAKAANPLVCRSAFSRLPTVESNGFERGTAAAGRCKALQCGRYVTE